MDGSRYGIVKVATSWTLMGGALRGLSRPLPSVGWRLHKRGRTIAPPIGTTEKIIVSTIVFDLPTLSFLLMLVVTFRCYTLRHACVGFTWLAIIAKICQHFKLGKGRIFIWSSSLITPPLDILSILQVVSEPCSPFSLISIAFGGHSLGFTT